MAVASDLIEKYWKIITGHFCGQDRAVGPVCVWADLNWKLQNKCEIPLRYRGCRPVADLESVMEFRLK